MCQKMDNNSDNGPVHVDNPIVAEPTAKFSRTTTNSTNIGTSGWTRLNHKGIYHDNRRLLKHRTKNCECFVCYREIYKLPPAESHEEYLSGLKTKIKEKEIKRAKRLAKKEVKRGEQSTINSFFQGSCVVTVME